METETILHIYGRVQGVGCRKIIQGYALERGIAGNVYNDCNGSVTITIQAKADVVREMKQWLHTNPGFTKIDRITTTVRPTKEKYQGFSIKKDKAFVPDQAQSLKNLLRRVWQ